MGAQTLEALVARLVAAFTRAGRSFEIVLVDDDSRDGSWEVIESLARVDARVLGVKLTRNFGQHNATLCGFRHARGRLIVTLDEDLQNPPEEIETMIETMRVTDADVVYGVSSRRKHSWWRRLCSGVVMLIPRRVMKIDFNIGSFRLIRAAIAREVAKADRHDIILDIYFAWTTSRIVATAVRHDEDSRESGSSYRFRKLLTVFLNMMCSYTTLPLRLASVTGIAISLVSMLMGVYFILVRLFANVPVPGFTALIVSILFSTGLMLMSVGIVSEYIARLFMRVNQKPQSVVRMTTSDGPRDGHAAAPVQRPETTAPIREMTDVAH
jgi:undecaprenyl-phosphate 4-deoxy-4-formamido-L-arabinose transferase